jgi:hypothetical protein
MYASPFAIRCKSLEAPVFVSALTPHSGGALCRPLTAPAQESEQKWGVSDPASAPPPRPRADSAGSLTPHVSVSVMCWGARLMVAEVCALMMQRFPGKQCPEISPIVLRNRVEFLHRRSHPMPSLRCSIFRERLGASRLRSLTLTACAASTRPARSRVGCSYRSDGAICSGDPV